jgi:uncharacterized membrane protein
MKKFFLPLLFAVSSTVFAQEKTAPRTEFLLELSSPTLEVKAGESKDVTITLNRSKAYSRSKAVLGLSSKLPEGITIAFEPAEGVIDSSKAKVTLSENVKPGNYLIILNGTIQHKSKGATLKVVVGEPVAKL